MFDVEWYLATLHACALDRGLDLLKEGDQTRIGSDSTVLSGGQKHRVALARAIYAQPKVIILDDVLSALDRRTQNAVVTRLFGERGLLRKTRTTTVLMTHAR